MIVYSARAQEFLTGQKESETRCFPKRASVSQLDECNKQLILYQSNRENSITVLGKQKLCLPCKWPWGPGKDNTLEQGLVLELGLEPELKLEKGLGRGMSHDAL